LSAGAISAKPPGDGPTEPAEPPRGPNMGLSGAALFTTGNIVFILSAYQPAGAVANFSVDIQSERRRATFFFVFTQKKGESQK
jgi:hypothetical protein